MPYRIRRFLTMRGPTQISVSAEAMQLTGRYFRGDMHRRTIEFQGGGHRTTLRSAGSIHNSREGSSISAPSSSAPSRPDRAWDGTATTFLQRRIVAELQAPLNEDTVALGLVLDELIEHRLVTGGVVMPPACANSDIEERRSADSSEYPRAGRHCLSRSQDRSRTSGNECRELSATPAHRQPRR